MTDELHEWAQDNSGKIAWRLTDGRDALSYGRLNDWSNRVAQFLIKAGLRQGDVIALRLPNCAEFIIIAWAARRLGLYYTPITVHLRAEEAVYILGDCGAKVFFTTPGWTADFLGPTIIVTPGEVGGPFEQLLMSFGDKVELPAASLGKDFVYSSGTTGRPKGVKRSLHADPNVERRQSDWIQAFSKHDSSSVCLTCAPLYHAAPLRFAMRSIQQGGTVLGMSKFEAADALEAVETWQVTHSLWVPTMFYRMLQLPEDQRGAYDLRSLRCAIHSAGPCAADLKRQMIEWWGPIVWEYYAASEGNGATCISSEEALQRPGSVGRAALGRIHIVGPLGNELPVGQTGEIYFEGGPRFEYHNDPGKTAAVRHELGWTSVGDIGHLDEEGYLYLSDRKSHTIISGGVNIYPAEIEHLLCRHPAVADAAVFGISNEEYGEEVMAVVEVHANTAQSDELARQLMDFCRDHLSPVKCPKSVVFEAHLPRGDNGKLSKVSLKQRFASISPRRQKESALDTIAQSNGSIGDSNS